MFASGVISAERRESWVGITIASWLYKTERVPRHADNCLQDAQLMPGKALETDNKNLGTQNNLTGVMCSMTHYS